MKEILLSGNTFAAVMMTILCVVAYIRNNKDGDDD